MFTTTGPRNTGHPRQSRNDRKYGPPSYGDFQKILERQQNTLPQLRMPVPLAPIPRGHNPNRHPQDLTELFQQMAMSNRPSAVAAEIAQFDRAAATSLINPNGYFGDITYDRQTNQVIFTTGFCPGCMAVSPRHSPLICTGDPSNNQPQQALKQPTGVDPATGKNVYACVDEACILGCGKSVTHKYIEGTSIEVQLSTSKSHATKLQPIEGGVVQYTTHACPDVDKAPRLGGLTLRLCRACLTPSPNHAQHVSNKGYTNLYCQPCLPPPVTVQEAAAAEDARIQAATQAAVQEATAAGEVRLQAATQAAAQAAFQAASEQSMARMREIEQEYERRLQSMQAQFASGAAETHEDKKRKPANDGALTVLPPPPTRAP